ncbi:MAG: branched-chain amino acid ABC transporter permease [Actinobacteria bacterium]|jgi:4-azaleucine resistance transporter AzlC|nr:branched-chain amino acid ABC transporter permease [Actinomycetota bacterium]MDP7549599.1 AzlC family ABC transporter permease [Acidimicrobiales bacterium]MBT3686672.1 branched-chain amino acid ABC transporter permease [Actinomycetota bacterium]MBT4037332.1 branched-chain amino acid ABC transporter permease [Actinomycetota bacterium]MBT4278016.1 branched-chain amino acid ABC transporter permease [Actinomycetota bacterium]|tara:strand:+ start:3870 stop:4565 length:696 start_codon:yes stop_codon:yes gene_type:complete
MRGLVGHRHQAFTLAAATGLIGITFGVFADTSGFSLYQASALSVLTFTGASQFAVVSVIAGGGSTAAAVGSGLLLAARNSLYGPVMAPMLGAGRGRRLVAAQFLIDETTAMATAQEDREHGRDAFWFTGIWLFLFWNTGTVLGVLLGGVLEDPGAWGLDAAFPAAFVALLVPHLRTRPGRVTALTGAAIAVVAVPTTAAGLPMLLAAAAVGPGLWVAARSNRAGGDSGGVL